MKTLILGGGLAGLSCSYHLGHENCLILDRNPYLGGHATTHYRDNSFWDEGPHVLFTKYNAIQRLLSLSSECEISEFNAVVGNFYAGNWIPHPAQSHLHAIPEPLAGMCYRDFLANLSQESLPKEPKNYQEWLDQSLGFTFSRTFSHAYTRKYWTCEPIELSTDWIGARVSRPDLQTITDGYKGQPRANTHYINSIRYPTSGGFKSFFNGLMKGAHHVTDQITSVDLFDKTIFLASGRSYSYDSLISTMPLDAFIRLLRDVPEKVQKAASLLRCSSLLLVNILGKQSKYNPYHWIYVYDENKYSTRVTQSHLLSSNNTPKGTVGIQIEVYESPYRPFARSHSEIAEKVINEAVEMNIIDHPVLMHYHYVPYANVIFDNNRRAAQDIVLSYLCQFGLEREDNDLNPMTDWYSCKPFKQRPLLALAGRFGQWKYFWSDDCILRGMQIAGHDFHRL